MTAEVTTLVRRRREELVRRAGNARDPAEVFDIASTRLRRLVPFDAAAWSVTDPATGLPAGPTRIDDLDAMTAAQCSEYWRSEFVHHDVNTFIDLARARRPAGALRSASGDPERSRRYRTVLRPLGYGDEMRAVLRTEGNPWGLLSLFRREGQPPFSGRETRLVAGLSAPLAGALRAHARPVDAVAGPPADRPGVLVFDARGDLQAADDQARAWLEELPQSGRCHPTSASSCPSGWSRRCSGPGRLPTGGEMASLGPGSAPDGAAGWCATPPASARRTRRAPSSRSWSRRARPRSPRWSSMRTG
jgi:hypothetical protein